jgi:hypothetical protein
MTSILSYGVIVLAVILMIVLAVKTDMLKDISNATDKPYSLSRVQFALWTLIVFCSFIYIWGQSSVYFEIGNTALILMGIGTGTAIVAKTVDDSDKKNLKNGLISAIHQDGGSEGLLRDILSDKTGVSVHRVQNVLFTTAMMVAFVVEVLKYREMPEFSNTMLMLAGVSAGGYLGVKVNENKV